MHEKVYELIAELTALLKDYCISDRRQFSKLLDDLNGLNYDRTTRFKKPWVSEKLLCLFLLC